MGSVFAPFLAGQIPIFKQTHPILVCSANFVQFRVDYDDPMRFILGMDDMID